MHLLKAIALLTEIEDAGHRALPSALNTVIDRIQARESATK